ncbi:MAG: hypothetical protein IKS02_02560 [Fibrobacter sp.]|nr:hypothetical protein [Fibrobacter sp.]
MNHIGLNGVLAVFSVIVVAALVACSGESSCTVETKLLEDESAGTSSSLEKLSSCSSLLLKSSSSSSSSVTSSSDSESANCKGVDFDSNKQVCDGRDKKVYKIATIGNQVWMAENMNLDYKLGEDSYGTFCYDDDSDNCSKYGRLYTWAAAMDSAGWHIPTIVEWETLLTKVGSGLVLKSKTGWKDVAAGKSGSGTDEYGFSALPAGFRFGPDDVSEEDIQNGESPYDGILKSADFWKFLNTGT